MAACAPHVAHLGGRSHSIMTQHDGSRIKPQLWFDAGGKRPTHLDENGVCYGLSRQAGSCRPECDRHLVPLCQLQQLHHLTLAVHFDHSLGQQPVKGGIRAVGQQVQGVGVQPCGGYHRACSTGEVAEEEVEVPL